MFRHPDRPVTEQVAHFDSNSELNQLSHTIAHRLARYLERQGLLERDAEHSTLALDDSGEDPMDHRRKLRSIFHISRIA